MKTLQKDIGVKGKALFHPARYALTGEMSGQDVTKQLSLVRIAEQNIESSVLNKDVVKVVGLKQRIDRLKAFLETIPEEYREAKTEEKKKKQKTEAKTNAIEKSNTPQSSADDAANQRASYDGPPITAL